MDYGLKGKVVFLTGAAQGIGRATAAVFAGYGSRIAIADINLEAAKKTAAELNAQYGVEAEGFLCDVSSEDAVRDTVDAIVAHFGKIDVLIPCAGITIKKNLVDCTFEFDRIMKINAYGTYYAIKYVAKQMIDKQIKGAIVCISSQNQKIAREGYGPYSCSKVVVGMLAQCFALELGRYGITISAVCPGYVNTELQQKVIADLAAAKGVSYEEFYAERCSAIPLGRLCEPEEVGEYCAFLASDKGRYITGCCMNITGGSTNV